MRRRIPPGAALSHPASTISNGFRLKGDVVALAAAVIIATAFGAVVASFVANVVTPLIAAIGGQPDFSELERGEDDTVEPPEYAVETGDASSISDVLNRRSADGWKVVSVGEGGDGRLSAVLVKGES